MTSVFSAIFMFASKNSSESISNDLYDKINSPVICLVALVDFSTRQNTFIQYIFFENKLLVWCSFDFQLNLSWFKDVRMLLWANKTNILFENDIFTLFTHRAKLNKPTAICFSLSLSAAQLDIITPREWIKQLSLHE